MEMSLFVKGLLIGFSIAAPVGPIGVLCVNRTLAHGRMAGLVSGLGAAAADGIYGAVAALGITFVSSFLVDHQVGFRIVGGLFLVYLGLTTYISRPPLESPRSYGNGLVSGFGTTFLLTLTNPVTIVAFAAVFAVLGLGNPQVDCVAAISLILGVFSGSALWWVILSSGTALILGGSMNHRRLKVLNRISGAIILGFGLAALASSVV